LLQFAPDTVIFQSEACFESCEKLVTAKKEFIGILADVVNTVFDLGGCLGTLKDIKKHSQTQQWIGPRLFH
jgi:hypothetical protein